MAPVHSNNDKPKVLRAASRTSQSMKRVRRRVGSLTLIETSQKDVAQKPVDRMPLCLQKDNLTEPTFADALEEVLTQESVITEALEEIERQRQELEALPGDLATFLEEVLTQQDLVVEEAFPDEQEIVKQVHVSETSRQECDGSTQWQSPCAKDDSSTRWQHLEETLSGKRQPSVSLESPPIEEGRSPKNETQETEPYQERPEQLQEVRAPQQDFTASPSDVPEAIEKEWHTQEFDLDEISNETYWGEDTTNDPFDDFRTSIEDMRTQEFSLEDVLKEASLEKNMIVDFGSAFRDDTEINEMSALTQEFSKMDSSAQDSWDGVHSVDLPREQMDHPDGAVAYTREFAPSEVFLDADYIDQQEDTLGVGHNQEHPYRENQDQVGSYREGEYQQGRYPEEQYQAGSYRESKSQQGLYPEQHYQELSEDEFLQGEPLYRQFLPGWVKIYERCSNFVFVFCTILLVSSAFVYMMDGETGRQVFSLAYYPVSESVQAAQSNEGSERLILTNLKDIPTVKVDQELLVKISNLSGAKTSVFLLQTVVEINGEQYYTDQGYTLSNNMIEGTPLFRVPFWVRLMSTYFVPILIIVVGLLALRSIFAHFFLYDLYKKCRIKAGEYSEEKERLSKKSKPKMILGFALNAIFIVLVILLIVLLGSGGQRSVLGHYFFSVLTTSMQADIPQGSLVIVKQVDPTTIEVGDDITFVQEGEKIITHRVIEVLENYGTNGERAFRTKGTANEMADPEVVFDSNVLGKVISHIEELGATMLTIQRNALPIGGFLVGLLLFIFFVKKALRVSTREEEQDPDDIEYSDDPDARLNPYPETGFSTGVDPQPMWEQV